MHWLIALTYLGLFCVGWYMVTLDYYHPWYIDLPHWHKSIGMLLILYWGLVSFMRMLQ
jgi:cytochrome b561